jgi:hypothetical protein
MHAARISVAQSDSSINSASLKDEASHLLLIRMESDDENSRSRAAFVWCRDVGLFCWLSIRQSLLHIVLCITECDVRRHDAGSGKV